MTEHQEPGPVVDPVEFRTQQARTVLERHIPARFADATITDPQITDWAATYLTNPAEAPSLLLTGPTGVGKTHTCWAILRHLTTSRAAAGVGLRWQFTTHPDLNDRTRPKPDESHAYALDPYQNAEFLILDDLGAGKQSEWTGDALHRLVDHRWAHQLVTVYSTNLTSKDLTEAVGDRVVSRLADTLRVVITGQDRRWGRSA